MKNKGNKLVWKLLTEDEKSSLLLSLSFHKSTWEAGELMNKAHYKYLEIQARANKFFKMYNEYFTATGNKRIPENCILNPNFRDFIIGTVFERKTHKDVVREMGNTAFVIASAKERFLREGLEYLSKGDELHQMLYDLILEFDRWNNYRILPISLQEPSAFKRRNKTRLMKHLKNLANLDEYHIRRFTKRFTAKKSEKNVVYIPVLSKSFDEGYEVIRIKNDPEIVDHISVHLRLYLFEEEVDAEKFGYMVNKYLNNQKKDCKIGQKFWPDYRQCIESASNYLQVNNIIPRRKHLEKAFRDMDHLNQKKKAKKEKIIGDPTKRAESNIFWSI